MKIVKTHGKAIGLLSAAIFIFGVGYVTGGIVLASNLYTDLTHEKMISQVRDLSKAQASSPHSSGSFDRVLGLKESTEITQEFRMDNMQKMLRKQIDKLSQYNSGYQSHYGNNRHSLTIPEMGGSARE